MKMTWLGLILILISVTTNAQVRIRVRLDPAFKGPYTGRLFIETLNDTTKQFGQPGAGPQASFAINVHDWYNPAVALVDSNADYAIRAMNKLAPGFYKVAAVLDLKNDERSRHAPGNLYSSQEALLEVKEGGVGETVVTINTEFKERQFRETPTVKDMRFKSALLSKFHKKPVFIKAAVVLPQAYLEDSTRVFPVVYVIPGWGGTHYDAQGQGSAKRYGFSQGLPKIFVYLNPETQTPFGLHGFVDSRVNGPWGRALVEELLPHVRRQYRASASFEQTFLMGQSTGGYTTAWLMFHYPKAFGGSWGTAPDPVDFSNFTGVNLYEDSNYYVDGSGQERPFYKLDGEYQSVHRSFAKDELFQGDGGQMQSFEAAYGLLAKNGKPRLLYDRSTGVIDKKVVEQWKPYDLGQYLLRNWTRLEKGLKGKIHLFAGSADNFDLNASLMAFRKKAESINADIVIEEIPGADHFSLWTPEFVERVHREMDGIILRTQQRATR